MLFLEQFPLIPLDGTESCDTETWLYVLNTRTKVSFVKAPNDSSFTALNSTISMKEASSWLGSIGPDDILLTDVLSAETIPEHEQTKIIDTRTFTRPRKGRLSSSPLRPNNTTINSGQNERTNLNSTFNFNATGAGQNGCEMLNATVVIEEALKEVEMNATFPVENSNGSPANDETGPCSNNNVYHLNTTFPSQIANRSVPSGPAVSKTVLNATYSESDEPVQGPTNVRNYSLDEMEELDEVDELIQDEAVFRKPLMPGAVPKRMLIRTSTLNCDVTQEVAPKKNTSPTQLFGLTEIEKIAKIQEDSLAQTSTPMGQRRFPGHRRPVDVDYNLGSPITSLMESPSATRDSTMNYGPPIPIREQLSGNSNSPDSSLDNLHPSSANRVGRTTFEKSHSSVEVLSNSPTSPAGSPYSSQSLENDAGPSSAQSFRRSMPNLNNPTSRLRLPQPSALASNLNRQHGSESGLRPPSANSVPPSSGIRPPVNGSLLRPQFKAPQLPPPSAGLGDAVKPIQPQQRPIGATTTGTTMPAPRSSLLPPSASRLKAPQQLAAPKVSALPVKPPPLADDLNSTVVVEKPVVVAAAASTAPAFSGIPRPSMMSRLPMPRLSMKSSIPTSGIRPRGTQ